MSILIVFLCLWIKNICIGPYSGHFVPYQGIYFHNYVRKPYQVIIFFRNKAANLAQTPEQSKVRNGEIFRLVVEYPILFH